MKKIEVKILNPESINQAEQMMVCLVDAERPSDFLYEGFHGII